MPASLRVAAAQFPVSGNIERNLGHIIRTMKSASEKGAQVVHFPEGALTGYAPKHLDQLDDYPWDVLESRAMEVRKLAARLKIRVVLGSMRRMEGQLPRNCLSVIGPTGEVEAMYDKRRLYENEKAVFSPGRSPCVVDIDGIRCGLLICYENCFPELYDEYRRLGVKLVFHSFHNAGNRGPTNIRHLMWATLVVRAADNHLWISAANSSEPYSPLTSCIIRPDGAAVRSRRHFTGFAIDDYPGTQLGWTYDAHRS